MTPTSHDGLPAVPLGAPNASTNSGVAALASHPSRGWHHHPSDASGWSRFHDGSRWTAWQRVDGTWLEHLPSHAEFGPSPTPEKGRPGTTIAAAVLGYVTAGLLILAGLLLLLGASAVHNFDDATGESHNNYVVQYVLLGIANLLAAGLLIAGAVSMTGRRSSGRAMFSLGGGIVIVCAIFWLVRWFGPTGGAVVFYTLLFCALVIIADSLAWTKAVSAWLAGGSRSN